MLKKILLLVISLGALGGGVGYYLWNKKMPSMATQEAAMVLGAEQLYAEFNADEAAATARYAGKIISVRGKVLESSKMEDGTPKVLLDTGSDFGISCEFDPNSRHARTEFQAGETLTVKGECAGLNLDVQLARCVVVQ